MANGRAKHFYSFCVLCLPYYRVLRVKLALRVRAVQSEPQLGHHLPLASLSASTNRFLEEPQALLKRVIEADAAVVCRHDQTTRAVSALVTAGSRRTCPWKGLPSL